jgi:hypothetical protein
MTTTTHDSVDPRTPAAPQPPSIDWKVAFLLMVLTLGLFQAALGIWQSRWARKIDPGSRALLYYIAGCVGGLLYAVLSADSDTAAVAVLLYLAAVVLLQCANFSLKRSIELYVHGSPAQVSLSAVATFFLGPLYLQYHLNQIEKLHKLRVAWA